MKKSVFVSALLFLAVSLFTIGTINAEKKVQGTSKSSAKIEVYYFHFTRRCATCQAVENESQKAIAALYPNQLKKGKVQFRSLNLDDKGSKVIADRCKAEGQALLIISGSKRVDLTDQGFMYARSKPEKLKEEIRKAIDPLIR